MFSLLVLLSKLLEMRTAIEESEIPGLGLPFNPAIS